MLVPLVLSGAALFGREIYTSEVVPVPDPLVPAGGI